LPGALVVPRDAVKHDGTKTFVRIRRGNDYQDQPVTIGAMSAHEAVVTAGSITAPSWRATWLDADGQAAFDRRNLQSSRNLVFTLIAGSVAVAGFIATAGGRTLPDVPTADVTRGDFIDTLEIRGEIRPLKSSSSRRRCNPASSRSSSS